MTEIWKEIPNFPMYEVSNTGFVRSWSRHGKSTYSRRKEPRILESSNQRGYLYVTLCNFPEQERVGIHRLVLVIFDKPCPDGMQCRHLDGNPANNHINNLTWGTPKENQADRIRHGTYCYGSTNKLAKLTESKVRKIRKLYASGKYTQLQLGNLYNVSRECIKQITTGRNWKHI